ncbi:hypothetical protein [Flavobacterium sp. GT3R68]|uniref:hypothetical protein n=1 Tax=Flavobacterium sp. GT3R68 TaxID=2594437 RepID=UPI000F863730|nr:hypothetical protein [Flavobacterium sp. GT3R68]RTY92506.1 hypothetical protein EKL32_17020 [Flavobacterium sp. GSN2]TRW94132.1 hypothetical protein FNW07_04235 [Flavobacterium sp. GT3R68]
MPLYKKVIIGLVSIIILLLLINLGVNFWVDRQLPKIISNKNKSSYNITYKNLDVSLWSGNIDATEVVIVPKAALNDTLQKAGIYSKIKSLQIKKFKAWDLIFDDKIRARSITINGPEVVIYKKNEKAINDTKSFRTKVVDPFREIIVVSDIYLKEGRLKMVYVKNNKDILSAGNINLQLEGIVITEETLKNKIPFSYQKSSVSCEKIYYRINPFYHLEAALFQKEGNQVRISKLALIPSYGRKGFVKRLQKEKDLYTVTTDSASINNIHWGFENDRFFINANAIHLDQLSANIYRSKTPPDDLKKKSLNNKLLRDLKFSMKIDTLSMRNSLVVYEEEIEPKRGPAKVSFSQFNLTATNIQSGFGQKKLPDTKIKINCRLMNTSQLKANWTFNVMDRSDGFKIRGSVHNFNTEKLYPFVKPYMNASIKGVLDEIHFNFTGNSDVMKGDLDLKYHDVKVTFYRKNKPEKKNKLKSFIANLLIKNDSDNKTKKADVEVKRIPEKSFYNLLWRGIAEGLKKILI